MTKTEKTFGGWTAVCVENDDQTKRCSVIQSRLGADRKAVILIWSISSKDKNEFTQSVTVPTGISIKEGVRLFIGDSDPLTMGYDFCGPRICIAQLPLDDKTVEAIKTGKKASASYVQGSKQLVQVELDLAGFADAYAYIVQQLS